MIAIYLWTLKESLHRRFAVGMLGIAAIVAISQIIAATLSHVPAAPYAQMHMQILLSVLTGLWCLLTTFAVAPLLSSHLEKGWAELLFAKGVSRRQITIARFGGAVSVFIITSFVFAVLPSGYMALRAGISFRPFLLAAAAALLSFTSYAALMLLLSSTTSSKPGAVLLVGGAFLQQIASALLAQRGALTPFVTWRWVLVVIEWCYRILPKNAELDRGALQCLATGAWHDWWAVWTTSLFIVVCVTWSVIRFHRRAI